MKAQVWVNNLLSRTQSGANQNWVQKLFRLGEASGERREAEVQVVAAEEKEDVEEKAEEEEELTVVVKEEEEEEGEEEEEEEEEKEEEEMEEMESGQMVVDTNTTAVWSIPSVYSNASGSLQSMEIA